MIVLSQDYSPFAEKVLERLREVKLRPVAAAVLTTPGTDEEEVRLAIALDHADECGAHANASFAGFDVIDGGFRGVTPANGIAGLPANGATVSEWRRFPWERAAETTRRLSGFWPGFRFGAADILYLEAENGHVIRDFPKVAVNR